VALPRAALGRMERLLEYVGNHPLLAAAAVLAALLVIAYEMRMRGGASLGVSPQDAIRLMNQGAMVLDLRSQQDFAAGHLNGARHMPADQILQAGMSLKKYKEKPIVVYCGTGSLGAPAARQLAAQGFTKAFNLRGGLAAWRAENLPLAKS
jgi:rhodanese-related sulfurtransferase